MLALWSTIMWSLSWIFNTKDNRDPIASLLLAFLFGVPFIFIIALATTGLAIHDVRGLLGAAYVGTFEMGIHLVVLWLRALLNFISDNTAKVGIISFFSPSFLGALVFTLIQSLGEEYLYLHPLWGSCSLLPGSLLQAF